MTLGLLDYRRRTHALYAAYRSAADHADAVETWRAARDELLHTHLDGPLRGRDPVPYAPYDPAVRHELEIDTAPDARMGPDHLDLATDSDGVVGLDRLGVVHVPELGDLDVWWLAQYGGGVFVPLRDGSCGTTTYGGGRYLLDTVKGADLGGDLDPATGRGTLVLDLNLAYHPSCTYDPRWSCPLAPPGNTVQGTVTAGELLPPGGWY